MAAEVKIKGVAELEEGLVKYLESVVNDDSIKQQIGEKAVQYIKASLRTGNEEYKQKPVSQGWADRRKVLAKTNSVSEFYPNGLTSRITFTGQLLDSLEFKPVTNGVVLSFEGSHTPYQTGKSKSGKAVANATIAEGLSRTRSLVFISAKLKTQLETIITREIRRKLAGYQRLSRFVAKQS
jgi:hypothetical protein